MVAGVERLPGDDAVATFGFDRAHEDDAGRAVRAAAAAASSVARAAVGVASGELIVGDDSILGARGVVRTARSLARLAASGEVLIDSGTVDLAPHAAEYEPVESGEQVAPAGSGSDPHRMTARPPARSCTAAFVNRKREFRALTRALDGAVLERRAKVVTILGSAGIGKSRLVREFTALSADRATVVGGRCLSYGEGTSVFALSEVVRGWSGGTSRQALRCDSRPSTGKPIAARNLLPLSAPAVRAALLRRSSWRCGPCSSVPRSRPAARRRARRRALAAACNCSTLSSTLAGFAAAPVLVITCARTDLLDERPEWARPDGPGEVIALESLSGAHTHELVTEMLAGRAAPASAVEHIATRSDGNPLIRRAGRGARGGARLRGYDGAAAVRSRALLQQRIDSLDPMSERRSPEPRSRASCFIAARSRHSRMHQAGHEGRRRGNGADAQGVHH